MKLIEEEHESFRDWLTTILAWDDLGGMTITLRGGKEIEVGGDPKKNLRGHPARVRVGKDYIDVDIAPAAGVPIFEISVLGDLVRTVLLMP